jgi:Ca-activated chloride channel family protein
VTAIPLVLLLTAAPQAAAPTPAPPRFGAEVSSVFLDVAVHRAGQPVANLTAADFEVIDDGTPQAVEVVQGTAAPVHAVLVLDVSQRMVGPGLGALRAAATSFLDALSPEDRVTVLTFSHRITLATPVAVTAAQARDAVARTEAGGGTGLHDATFAALALADRRNGRPVVFLFSDGHDTTSWLTEAKLRALAADADAVVHSVASVAQPDTARQSVSIELDDRGRRAREMAGGTGMGTATSDSQRQFDAWSQSTTRRSAAAEVPAVLRTLAEETGGDVFRVQEGGSLRDAFLAALQDVRSRYVLRFEPSSPGARGAWRRVEVRVKGKADVRARRGYRVR